MNIAEAITPNVSALGVLTLATTLDASKSNVFSATLGAASIAFSIQNVRAGQEVTLVLTQDATGGRVATFAGAGGQTLKATSAAAIVASTGAGIVSVLKFTGIDATNVQLTGSLLGA